MLEFAFIFPLVVVVAALVFWVARRGPLRSVPIADQHLDAAVSVNRYFRRRSLIVLVAVVVFGTVPGVAFLYGIRSTARVAVIDPLRWALLTPIFIAVGAVASFAFVPPFREAEEVRAADPMRRTPLTFGPPRIFFAPVIAAVLVVAIIAWFGLISAPDGRMLVYDNGPGGGFPGFSYGLPLLFGVVILGGVTLVALLRTASAPRPTDPALRSADATVRLLTIRIVLNSVTTAIILTIGILLVWAGSTADSMARTTRIDSSGDPLPPDATLQAIGTWGMMGVWAGIACFAATVVFLVLTLSDATRKPFEMVPIAAEAL